MSPIYEYECRFCKKTTEKFQKVTRVTKKIRCECGHVARRVLSRGAIRCDDQTNVKWLESAKQNLPDDAARISTRGEHAKYLKAHNLEAVG